MEKVVFAISRNRSPPISLPRNCFPFISRDPGPSMAHKIRVFNALVLEKETLLRRGEGGYAVEHLRPLKSAIQVRCNVGPQHCCEVLRCSVACLAAAYPRLHCTTHFFLYFGSFLYYLASFLIPISTCPIKHYSMGD